MCADRADLLRLLWRDRRDCARARGRWSSTVYASVDSLINWCAPTQEMFVPAPLPIQGYHTTAKTKNERKTSKSSITRRELAPLCFAHLCSHRFDPYARQCPRVSARQRRILPASIRPSVRQAPSSASAPLYERTCLLTPQRPPTCFSFTNERWQREDRGGRSDSASKSQSLSERMSELWGVGGGGGAVTADETAKPYLWSFRIFAPPSSFVAVVRSRNLAKRATLLVRDSLSLRTP